MKRKKLVKKVQKAIIEQIQFRIAGGWQHDHDHESCYMLPVDDCYDIISTVIHPNLKGWKRFQELSNRDWSLLSEKDVLFMDNAFCEDDWDIFYDADKKAMKKIAKHLSALL